MCAYQAKRMDVAEGGCWRILFVGLTRKNRSGNKLTIAKVIHLFIHIPDGIAHQLAHTHSQCGSYLGHQTKRRNGACSWCGPFCEAALRSSLGSTLGCMCMFRPDICFYDACESLYGALWVLAVVPHWLLHLFLLIADQLTCESPSVNTTTTQSGRDRDVHHTKKGSW